MTRFGKCDICRRRKVKCDEQRPTCGQCAKKKRPCQYEYVKVSRFINSNPSPGEVSFTLQLDGDEIEALMGSTKHRHPRMLQPTTLSVGSVKSTTNGTGAFHTLVPIRSGGSNIISLAKGRKASPTPSIGSPTVVMPSDSATWLRARFIHMVGEKPHPFNPTFIWGSWVSMVPRRIGYNDAFNDATASFIAANIARHDMTEKNITIARAHYSKALSSLRSAISETSNQKATSEILGAVKMLVAFERLLGMRHNRWVSHLRGMVYLFKTRGPRPDADDMDRSLFYSLLPCELGEALSNGTDSAFDSEAWLDFTPPEEESNSPLVRHTYNGLIRQLILIPRLVRLVRSLKVDSGNIDSGMEALQLAEELYLISNNELIDKTVRPIVKWMPTKCASLSRYFSESMEFPAIDVFDTAIRYSYSRILINGLCQSLREIFPFSPILEKAPLEEEELRQAEVLAMSVQHAQSLNDPMPLGSFLLGQALLFSYGAWRRLEGTNRVVDDGERHKARFMKEWVRKRANEMISDWDGQEVDKERLETETTALEGGPLMPWMRREIIPL